MIFEREMTNSSGSEGNVKNPKKPQTQAQNEAYLRTQPAFSDLSARGLAMDLLDRIPVTEELTLLAAGQVRSYPAVLAVTDQHVLLSVPGGLASSVHVYEPEAGEVEMDSSGYLNRVTLDPAGDVFMFDFKSERDWKAFRKLLAHLGAEVQPGVERIPPAETKEEAREREILAVINQSTLPEGYAAPVKYAASRLDEDEMVIAAATAIYHEPCVLVLTDKCLHIVERHGHTHRLSMEIRYEAISQIDREKGKGLRIWQGRNQTTITALDNPDMVRNVIERLRDAGREEQEPPTPFASASPAEDLKKLADLFAAGYLTEEEFTNAKKRVFLA